MLKKLLKKIKKVLTKNIGVSILAALIFIFAIFTFTYLFNARNVSSIEEKQIKDSSSELMYFIDDSYWLH